MHFTPQYGDSFIEELRLLLLKGRFEKIEMLKRVHILRNIVIFCSGAILWANVFISTDQSRVWKKSFVKVKNYHKI